MGSEMCIRDSSPFPFLPNSHRGRSSASHAPQLTALSCTALRCALHGIGPRISAASEVSTHVCRSVCPSASQPGRSDPAPFLVMQGDGTSRIARLQ